MIIPPFNSFGLGNVNSLFITSVTPNKVPFGVQSLLRIQGSGFLTGGGIAPVFPSQGLPSPAYGSFNGTWQGIEIKSMLSPNLGDSAQENTVSLSPDHTITNTDIYVLLYGSSYTADWELNDLDRKLIVRTYQEQAVLSPAIRYVVAPFISSVTPNIIKSSGTSTVTIVGSELSNIISITSPSFPSYILSFNSSTATNTSVAVNITIPSDADPNLYRNEVPIRITTVGGQAEISVIQSPLPSITNITPSIGTDIGGQVLITGYGFQQASSVHFNDVPISFNLTSVSSLLSTISVSYPAITVGTSAIFKITTPLGTATSSSSQFSVTSSLPIFTSVHPNYTTNYKPPPCESPLILAQIGVFTYIKIVGRNLDSNTLKYVKLGGITVATNPPIYSDYYYVPGFPTSINYKYALVSFASNNQPQMPHGTTVDISAISNVGGITYTTIFPNAFQCKQIPWVWTGDWAGNTNGSSFAGGYRKRFVGGNLTGLNQVRWAIGNTNGSNYAIVNGTNIEVESDTVASVIIPSISNLGITNSTYMPYSGSVPVYTDFGNTYGQSPLQFGFNQALGISPTFGNIVTSYQGLSDAHYWTPPPTLDSIQPNTDYALGGNIIYLYGKNIKSPDINPYYNDPSILYCPNFGYLVPTKLSNVELWIDGITALPNRLSSSVIDGFIIPTSTSNGLKTVRVRTNKTQEVTKTNFFAYQANPAVSITNISPIIGSSLGGTQIAITGSNLSLGSNATLNNEPTIVQINGVTATSVIVNSPTSITAITPALPNPPTSAVAVSVKNSYGFSSLPGAFTFFVPTSPTISSVSPSAGLKSGGTAITISGAAFNEATSVTIDGVAATSVVVVSPAQITAVTPAGTPGAKPVVVTTPYGTATATNAFTYLSGASVALISPNFTLPGLNVSNQTVSPTTPTPVTITGVNLLNVTGVQFGGNTTVSSQQNGFTGTNFSVIDSTTIAVTVPALTEFQIKSLDTGNFPFNPGYGIGYADVVLVSPTGNLTLPSAFQFRIAPQMLASGALPAMFAVAAPALSPQEGGISVTIIGRYLLGITSVKFNGVEATSVVVNSSTSLTVVTPPTTANGAVSVSSTNSHGTNTWTSTLTPFKYYIRSTPIVAASDGLTGEMNAPYYDPINGIKLTVSGFIDSTDLFGFYFHRDGITMLCNNITNGCNVAAQGFNNTALLTKSNANGLNISLTSPNWDIGATLGRNYEYKAKCIYNFGGSYQLIGQFGQFSDFSTPNSGYRALPVITSVSPTAGTTAGGGTMIITGQAFWNIIGVQFGGITAQHTPYSPQKIYVTIPESTAGAKNVDVICQHGTTTAMYTYYAFPTISSVSPNSGPRAGGTAITITGTNFPPGSTVLVGGKSATSVVVVSLTKITAVTPAGYATPTVESVTVFTGYGTSANKPNAFTYT